MPGPSWSISAELCPTGQRLRETVPDSPCAMCYALRGHYVYPKVRNNQAKRLQAWNTEPQWVDLMARYIELSVSVGDPYFRWFASGDLLSLMMLNDIANVARRTPNIHHWLPTQERDMVRTWFSSERLPPNLTIRISTPTINGVPAEDFPASVVVPRTAKPRWWQRLKRSSEARYFCPSSQQDGQCKTCRACWDRDTKVIAYLEH